MNYPIVVDRSWVGTVGYSFTPGLTWLHWVIDNPQNRRRGYATAAVRLLLDELHRCDVHRVYVMIRPHNKASLALAARVGFVETVHLGDPENVYLRQVL